LFVEVLGRKNVVCFQDFCNHLVNNAWYCSDDDDDTVAVKKVKEAATLIRAQTREMEYSNNEYPNMSDLYLEKCKADAPSLLHVFINILVPNDLKTVSIAQALIQASRPRTFIMPLMLYLAVQIDHMYGSEQLLLHLSGLGFWSSVDEMTRYKQSVKKQRSVSLAFLCDGNFAAVNPKLPRLKSRMTVKNQGIPIHVYSKMFGAGIDHLDLKSVHLLMQPVVLHPVVNVSS